MPNPCSAASGYQGPAFIVMDKGESLRDFVNQSTDADMARLHALHALCVLARHLKVGRQICPSPSPRPQNVHMMRTGCWQQMCHIALQCITSFVDCGK